MVEAGAQLQHREVLAVVEQQALMVTEVLAVALLLLQHK
jgi:hypothetical protein